MGRLEERVFMDPKVGFEFVYQDDGYLTSKRAPLKSAWWGHHRH